MSETHFEDSMDNLFSRLNHQPVPLAFGTSGRRGLLNDLTQLEIFINARAELEYLKGLPRNEGGIVAGDEVFFAADLRPSSTQRDAEGRGELAQAVESAIRVSGLVPRYMGQIPTPALTAYALSQGRASIMVTGSHIPFDRNGYKTNTSRGELLKSHEAPINALVEEFRAEIYGEPFSQSLFDADGNLKTGSATLPSPSLAAREAYIQRYVDFFGSQLLRGFRLVVYQHSAVGRDLLPEILEGLGAEVIPTGRSETFVPIDTENVDTECLATIQNLLDEAIQAHGRIDALLSTDGDSDRPLVIGVDPDSGQARFFGGDLVGMVTAAFLGAETVVVPVSCNDAIDRGPLKSRLRPKTRIGSPFVIEGMEAAIREGARAVCGWEANGGFLVATPFTRHGRSLAPLATRDAVLPMIAVLAAAREREMDLIALFDELPPRFSKAALIKNFPRTVSLSMIASLTPSGSNGPEIRFLAGDVVSGQAPLSQAEKVELETIRERLGHFFTEHLGFGRITALNYTDGLRIYFENGDVAHIRPSGNADELRIYAVSDSQDRADEITEMAILEPNGILRSMERALGS